MTLSQVVCEREEKRMKRATLLAVLVALTVALSAGAALAALNNINCPNRDNNRCVGTPQDDKLGGTPEADKMYGRGGHDVFVGFGGNDLQKGLSGDDRLQGGPDNDKLLAGNGLDEAYGSTGDDSINVSRDDDTDYAYCGAGYDTVRLDLQDIIGDQSGEPGDGQQAGDLLDSLDVLPGIEPVFNCERIVVEGTLVVEVPQL
jgi:Ca2+-binding RTX toxin-like protein